MNNLNPVLIQMQTHMWYEVCYLSNMVSLLISKVPDFKEAIVASDIEFCRQNASEAVKTAMEQFRDELLKEANKPENVSVEWDRPDGI